MEKKDFLVDAERINKTDETTDEILKFVLEKIKPTEKDQAERKKIANEIINKIKDFKFNADIVGSLAKDTNLLCSDDIDIFVFFPMDKPIDFLESKVIEIGKKILPEFEIDYAEHPYIKGIYKNYLIEIVPCYDFGKEIYGKFKNIATAVDRTPYHTKYVKEKISKLKISDDIRLLKQFMKGINVYGAESKVSGFSGYLVELLCIYYGSFKNVLLHASKWKFNEFIDIENRWKGKGKILFSAPLVVIDPVDENRNVAAAVNKQKMSEFIYKSREFIKNPTKEFFFPEKKEEIEKKFIIDKMRERETKFICIAFNHKKINLNNLYTQLEKTKNSIINEFKENGFRVLNSRIWSNELNLSIILFEFEVWKLPKIKKQIGPPVDIDEIHQEAFLAKHNAKIENDRWVAYPERKYKTASELIEKILSEKKGFGDSFKKVEGALYEDENILLNKEFAQFLWDSLLYTKSNKTQSD